MTASDTRSAPTKKPSPLSPAVWWLSPVLVSLLVAALAIASAALFDDRQFRARWRTPKWLTLETLTLFGCGALAIALGALVAMAVIARVPRSATGWPGLTAPSLVLMRRAGTVFTALTVLGYAGFGFLILRSGLDPAQLGSAYTSTVSVRDTVGTIPGLTTLTQFGIPAVVASGLVLAHGFARTEVVKLSVVGGLAVARAYMFSERLAVLELVVPLVVIWAGYLVTRQGWRRRVLSVIPLAFPIGVIVLFGVFEYFRSWTYFRGESTISYGEFVTSRIAGYYATALNNGHLLLEHLRWPGKLPYDTLEGFWVAPGIEQYELYERLGGYPRPVVVGDSDSAYNVMLAQFGNPEFNNQSGYASVFADYGTVGGIICFLLIGVAAGMLYRGFGNGGTFGLCLYPVFFVGLLEMPRYLYWTQGRAVYAWIGLLVVAVLLSRTQARERHAP